MTREEAIRIAQGLITDFKCESETMVEFCNVAIKSLKQEQKTGPCGDVISRQAVLDKKELVELEDGQSFYCISPEDVKSLPPVNPQEPKYCDRNICTKNEYNGIGCNECEVTKSQEPQETETWNGYHGQITAPKGTFERIFNDADDDNDI